MVTCEPRWATSRSPERPTIGAEIGEISRALGFEFMPCQQLVADVGGELMVDEEVSSMLDREIWVPAYPEVVLTIPRQAGKTIMLFAWQFHRALRWVGFDGAPQQIAYTAQDGSAARQKLRNDILPELQRSVLGDEIADGGIRLASDDMGILFRNESRLAVRSTSKSAGHGATLDMGVLDEMFDDEDDRREQAMIPAMATRHDRQKLVTSTAEDERGVIMRRKRRVGRAAVDSGRREGVAYFEWSADAEADSESPDTWRACHPALGHTITERTIQTALDEMRDDGDLTEFSRAWLNVPVVPAAAGSDGVWSPETWAGVCVEDPVYWSAGGDGD